MDIFYVGLVDRNNINLTASIKSDDIISKANSFSPDGQSFVFTSNRDGNKEIYLMKINGEGLQRLTNNEYEDYEPTFSSTGEFIAFTSKIDGKSEISILSLESKSINRLTDNNNNDWSPRFYSDGKKIFFQSDRDGNWEIYMMNTNGDSQINISKHPATDYSFTVMPFINH